MKRVLVIGATGLLGREIVKALRDRAEVVEASGVLAQHPMPGGAIFTTVNAAIEGFARAAAVELGRRVRVNVVSPRWIRETLRAMGMDESIGLSAAEAAVAHVRQIEGGASGSVLVAAREG
jgi:NAD(P)-dependent dehydrogenase (short-subunit alcohol dehydrogenase family)